MGLRYVIRHTWPSGKVRYRTPEALCVDIEDAHVYTLHEASIELKKSHTAWVVWRIVSERIRV